MGISITSILVVLASAYVAFTVYTLYNVANPSIPPIVDENGASLETLSPLWVNRPLGLNISLASGYTQRGKTAKSRVSRLQILSYRSDNFTFTTESASLALDILLVMSNDSLTLRCNDEPAVGSVCRKLLLPNNTEHDDAVINVVSNEEAEPLVLALRNGHAIHAEITLYAVDSMDSASSNPHQPRDFIITERIPLVSLASYAPPRTVRFLLHDPDGSIAERDASAARQRATIPVENGPSLSSYKVRDYLRPLNATTTVCRGNEMCYIPSDGQPWPHFTSHIDIKLVVETSLLPKYGLPHSISSMAPLDSTRQAYLPKLIVNPVQPLQEARIPLNTTLTSLPLSIKLSPISLGTVHLLRMLDAGIASQQSLGASNKDTDDVIRMISETPTWLFCVTMVVSFVHILFDMLALSSDVSFWSNTATLKGISRRSLLVEFASQSVVSLYLYNERASLLVLGPQVAFNVLLVAKIIKAYGVVWRKVYLCVYVPHYDAQLAATAGAGGTNKHDREAILHMTAILAPLFFGFVVYTLVYQQHQGWSHWLLSASVSAVYGCGFVLMTPQLWINYKLRSVAHMPWNVLTYRFFNTIIDDLFASIIKMPMMHRISVFRDDVIFIIYMYQRWKYPVDASRPAEGYDAANSAEDGASAGAHHATARKQKAS